MPFFTFARFLQNSFSPFLGGGPLRGQPYSGLLRAAASPAWEESGLARGSGSLCSVWARPSWVRPGAARFGCAPAGLGPGFLRLGSARFGSGGPGVASAGFGSAGFRRLGVGLARLGSGRPGLRLGLPPFRFGSRGPAAPAPPRLLCAGCVSGLLRAAASPACQK